jgi:RNA polymerase sigma-70 factor (ECF subfamily)
MKAIAAFPQTGSIVDPEGWLFRIAHNTAVDFLRQRARQNAARSDEDPDMVVDTASTPEDRQFATASLRTFMRLPVAQRSSVILMDVLGYSLDEIGRMMDASIPAVKAALHRGRERLREIAKEPEDIPVPVLPESERALLAAYVDRFNARDFDAIRHMLADEVRLELVNRTRMNGRSEVARYFHNYNTAEDWQFVPALVDRRPALVVRDPGDPLAAPAYFVLLQWAGDRLTNIRDFRYARYAIEGAEIVVPR